MTINEPNRRVKDTHTQTPINYAIKMYEDWFIIRHLVAFYEPNIDLFKFVALWRSTVKCLAMDATQIVPFDLCTIWTSCKNSH